MKNNIKYSILLILLAVFSACDSNVDVDDDTGTGSTSLSEPTNEVAVNTAPVAQVLADDVLNVGQDVRDNISDYVDEMTGVSDGNTTGSNFLRFVQTSAITEEFPISDSIDCDGGGSREVSGEIQVTLNEDQVSGSMIGTFTISYDNCIETVLLTSDEGACASQPTIAGDLPGSIDSEFDLSSYQESENIVDTTLVEASSDVAMDISVAATASEQFYAIDYTLLSSSGNTGFEGTVAYEGDVYDLSEIEDFIATLSSDVACP